MVFILGDGFDFRFRIADGTQIELVGALGQLSDSGIVESIKGRYRGHHIQALQIVVIGLEGRFEHRPFCLLPVLLGTSGILRRIGGGFKQVKTS